MQVRAFCFAGALGVAVVHAQASRVNGGLPAVSPDGRHIAFWGDHGTGPQVFVIDTDGTHEVQLTDTPGDGGRPAWSRDGRSVVYAQPAADTGPSRVFEVRADGTSRRQVANIPGRSPVLLPDGERVLFVSGPWSMSALFVARRDGSDARRISGDGASTWNPAVSPDGKQVAYTRASQGQTAVWVMNVDGSAAHAVTHFLPADGRAQVPAWSPDGTHLAFQVGSRSRQDSTRTVAHIWVVDLRSGALTKLGAHDAPYLDEGPSWFPDGRRIAFQSDRTGRMEVWVMNADGSAPRQVTAPRAAAGATGVSDTPPALAVGGAMLAFSVRDLDASAKWYTEKLGLRIVHWYPRNKAVHARAALFQGGGLVVELVQEDDAIDAGAQPRRGLAKAGVVLNNFDQAVATLRARGVEFASRYPRRPDQPANVTIRDNAGNLISLYEGFSSFNDPLIGLVQVDEPDAPADSAAAGLSNAGNPAPSCLQGRVLGKPLKAGDTTTSPGLPGVTVAVYTKSPNGGAMGDALASTRSAAAGVWNLPRQASGPLIITFVPPPSSGYQGAFATCGTPGTQPLSMTLLPR
jgi:Tol biopolymer transport system component/catechol 2,3-dioxygenase-like lactoylglutathione lyase family enzyme